MFRFLHLMFWEIHIIHFKKIKKVQKGKIKVSVSSVEVQTTKNKQDCSEYVVLKVSEGLTEEI